MNLKLLIGLFEMKENTNDIVHSVAFGHFARLSPRSFVLRGVHRDNL